MTSHRTSHNHVPRPALRGRKLTVTRRFDFALGHSSCHPQCEPLTRGFALHTYHPLTGGDDPKKSSPRTGGWGLGDDNDTDPKP